MIDREKTIRDLEVVGAWHTHHYEPFHYECAETIHNALELLKEPTVAKDTNVPNNGWISVKDRLPEEHESIFHKFLGTRKWSSAMWQQESDKVLVCVSFPDGTSVVTTGCLHNSDWVTTVSNTLPQTVTHWMPLPEPPKEEDT